MVDPADANVSGSRRVVSEDLILCAEHQICKS